MSGARRRGTRVLALVVAGAIGAAIGVGSTSLALRPEPSRSSAPTSAPPAPPAPPTRARGDASVPPWPAPADVAGRAGLAGLSLGRAEERFHIHSHLSVTVDGRAVTVPAHIGIGRRAGHAVYSPLHTHDTSGIVHIESAVRARFTLAQVFTEWDVGLGTGSIGALGTSTGQTVTVFVDGRPVAGDPGAIVLRNLQNIDIVVVPVGTPAAPPGGFYWPPNY